MLRITRIEGDPFDLNHFFRIPGIRYRVRVTTHYWDFNGPNKVYLEYIPRKDGWIERRVDKHWGCDASTMSDSELLNRATEIQRRINHTLEEKPAQKRKCLSRYIEEIRKFMASGEYRRQEIDGQQIVDDAIEQLEEM
jgi:hypothetical protein